jgi:hypothetical protein
MLIGRESGLLSVLKSHFGYINMYEFKAQRMRLVYMYNKTVSYETGIHNVCTLM